MPIYSKNRSGMLKESVGSYGMNDAGRIIYESFVNDHTIFECVIEHDKNEIQGLREGTILEADIEKDNKKTIADFKNSLLDLAKRTWEKILGMLRDLKTKVIAFLMNDGKLFVNNYNKFRNAHLNSDTEIEAEIYTGEGITSIYSNLVLNSALYIEDEEEFATKYIDSNGNFDRDAFLKMVARVNKVPSDYESMEDIEKYYAADGFAKTKIKISSDEEKALLKTLGNAKKFSDGITSMEKSAKTMLDRVSKTFKSEAIYEKNSMAVKQYYSFLYYYITKCTSICVSKIRRSVSCARKALGALMAKVKADEKGATKSQTESAILTSLVEAAIELDDAFDDEPSDDTAECDNLEDSEECDF